MIGNIFCRCRLSAVRQFLAERHHCHHIALFTFHRSCQTTVTTMTSDNPPANLDDPQNVRRWLQSNHPKQFALLDNFEIELRLGRFSSSREGSVAAGAQGSSTSSRYQYGRDRRLVTTRTVELLRAIIGPTRWKTAAQLLTLLRGLGNELHAAGGYREPAIGNVVRRIMYAVRDEADRVSIPTSSGVDDMEKIDELTEHVSSKLRVSAGKELSLASMLWAHPQHVTMKHSRQQSGDYSDRLRSDSMGSESGGNATSSIDGWDANGAIYPPHFYSRRDDLRQSVMEAIQEMMSELEDLHKNINEQATQHIHAGEIILTYALSKTVELFLKAAAAKKRKFQVIVCEGAPHFGGHSMAKSLAEAGIDTTVIHDAATFAIMARVNKVLLPAHAVLVSAFLFMRSAKKDIPHCLFPSRDIIRQMAGLLPLVARTWWRLQQNKIRCL
eukprot:CCRYP_008747-RA/>CCRYP_008747-RA protein AED:0.02 eAED:0.02 QI:224/1/1/1/1/1/2/355/440